MFYSNEELLGLIVAIKTIAANWRDSDKTAEATLEEIYDHITEFTKDH